MSSIGTYVFVMLIAYAFVVTSLYLAERWEGLMTAGIIAVSVLLPIFGFMSIMLMLSVSNVIGGAVAGLLIIVLALSSVLAWRRLKLLRQIKRHGTTP